MGKIKATREDIIRETEYKTILLRTRSLRSRALVSILYGFGKRISEILSVKNKDVKITEEFIEIKFKILKRKPEAGIQIVRPKRILRSHYTAEYIAEWFGSRERPPDGWLFPGSKGNHLNRVTAWILIKKIDQDLWPHLFRHSLATLIAENGATLWEIKAFFDWADSRTAQKYVAETPEIADKFFTRRF